MPYFYIQYSLSYQHNLSEQLLAKLEKEHYDTWRGSYNFVEDVKRPVYSLQEQQRLSQKKLAAFIIQRGNTYLQKRDI